jgi:hypothetical protein
LFTIHLVWMTVLDMSTSKGKKRIKDTPVLYDEVKKRRGVWLTDTSWHSVQELAVRGNMSASEYVENLIRKCCVTEG